jgi:hypothetical protein
MGPRAARTGIHRQPVPAGLTRGGQARVSRRDVRDLETTSGGRRGGAGHRRAARVARPGRRRRTELPDVLLPRQSGVGLGFTAGMTLHSAQSILDMGPRGLMESGLTGPAATRILGINTDPFRRCREPSVTEARTPPSARPAEEPSPSAGGTKAWSRVPGGTIRSRTSCCGRPVPPGPDLVRHPPRRPGDGGTDRRRPPAGHPSAWPGPALAQFGPWGDPAGGSTSGSASAGCAVSTPPPWAPPGACRRPQLHREAARGHRRYQAADPSDDLLLRVLQTEVITTRSGSCRLRYPCRGRRHTRLVDGDEGGVAGLFDGFEGHRSWPTPTPTPTPTRL